MQFPVRSAAIVRTFKVKKAGVAGRTQHRLLHASYTVPDSTVCMLLVAKCNLIATLPVLLAVLCAPPP